MARCIPSRRLVRRGIPILGLLGGVAALAAAPIAAATAAVSLAPSVQPTGTAADEKKEAPKKAEIDEKAQEVLDRAIATHLGAHAKKKDIRSVRSSGAMVMQAMGMTADIEMLMDGEGNVAIQQTIPNFGTVRSGVTDGVGWSFSELTGPTIMSDAEVAQTRQQADIYGELNWADRASSITYAGESTVTLPDGSTRPTHQLTVVDRATGNEETHHYDLEKGWRVQSVTTQMVPGQGEIPLTTTFLDYKKIGEMQVPHRSVVSVGPQEIEMRISEWEVNADVPKDAFAMPEEVKAIAERDADG